MVLHHTKHHQTYVNGLNAAENSYAQTTSPKERIALQAALKFNGGGKIDKKINIRSIVAIANRQSHFQVISITHSFGESWRLSAPVEVNVRTAL